MSQMEVALMTQLLKREKYVMHTRPNIMYDNEERNKLHIMYVKNVYPYDEYIFIMQYKQ